MKRMVWLLAALMLLAGTPAAAAPAEAGQPLAPKVTVLLFVESEVRQDEGSMRLILAGVKEKFPQAETIVYDDNNRKSPEYMELIENIKTDPINEYRVRAIGMQHLAKYARDINSRYVAVIDVSTWKAGLPSMQLYLTVADAQENRYLVASAWNAGIPGLPNYQEAAGSIMKTFGREFSWSPGEAAGPASAATGERIKVIAILANPLLEQPKLVEKIKQTVGARFKVSDVPIYIDGKAKSPEVLELFAKIHDDSAKQKFLVVKKEPLVKYGQDTGAVYVAAVIIDISEVTYLLSGYGVLCKMKLKESVFLVDVYEGRYAQNAVYESDFVSEQAVAVDFLLDKLQKDFKLR